MTPKQTRFVEEYLIDLNATQAAIRAGYSTKTAEQQGYQLLQHPSVAAAISESKEQRSEDAKIDAAYVLRQAVKLHERCMQEIEPILDASGAPVTDSHGRSVFKFNAAGAAKALELIGRHVGVQAYSERVEHRHTVSVDEARMIVASLLPRYGAVLSGSMGVVEGGPRTAH